MAGHHHYGSPTLRATVRISPANGDTPGWPQISQGHLVQERPSSDVVRVLLLVWLGSCVGLL
jgi:hypothetical protein